MRLEEIPRSCIYLLAALACLFVFYATDAADEESAGLTLERAGMQSVEVSPSDEAHANGDTSFDIEKARKVATVSSSPCLLASPFAMGKHTMEEEMVQDRTVSPSSYAAQGTKGNTSQRGSENIPLQCKGMMRIGHETILFLHYGGEDFAIGIGETKHGVTLHSIVRGIADVEVQGTRISVDTGE